jgi:hypothetical protein
MKVRKRSNSSNALSRGAFEGAGREGAGIADMVNGSCVCWVGVG